MLLRVVTFLHRTVVGSMFGTEYVGLLVLAALVFKRGRIVGNWFNLGVLGARTSARMLALLCSF